MSPELCTGLQIRRHSVGPFKSANITDMYLDTGCGRGLRGCLDNNDSRGRLTPAEVVGTGDTVLLPEPAACPDDPPFPQKNTSATATTTIIPTIVAIVTQGLSKISFFLFLMVVRHRIRFMKDSESISKKLWAPCRSQVYPGRYTGTQLSLSFFYHLPERFQEVFKGYIVFFGEQDECCRREEVAIISVFDDIGSSLRQQRSPPSLRERVIRITNSCTELLRSNMADVGLNPIGRVTSEYRTGEKTGRSPGRSALLPLPGEEAVRLFGAHPFAVKGIVIDDLVLAHPVFAYAGRERRRWAGGHFGAPRRIFFISRASSPSPRPSFGMSISVREPWSLRRR